MKKIVIILVAAVALTALACAAANREAGGKQMTNQAKSQSGTIPENLEKIPAAYQKPAAHAGRLEKLTYQTWEAFSYQQHGKRLTKTAYVYLPYGYNAEKTYNVFYLSHGGWSNETTIMGNDRHPNRFKNVIDHAIADGKMRPMILVMPTYNNTGRKDSWDYSLALELTDRYHNELVNDLIPAVESKYSTYAKNMTPAGIRASHDHRGFGGFSMGSVNTWCTFRYALADFRYFMPMSGNYGSAHGLADAARKQGYGPEDFFIYAMSGPDDFAYAGLKNQIDAMKREKDMFIAADDEADGNLAFREMAGYEHGPKASNLYTYNGLQFFWNKNGR